MFVQGLISLTLFTYPLVILLTYYFDALLFMPEHLLVRSPGGEQIQYGIVKSVVWMPEELCQAFENIGVTIYRVSKAFREHHIYTGCSVNL